MVRKIDLLYPGRAIPLLLVLMTMFSCGEDLSAGQNLEPTPQPIPPRTLTVIEASQFCDQLQRTAQTFEVEGTYAAFARYLTKRFVPEFDVISKRTVLKTKTDSHQQVVLLQEIVDENGNAPKVTKFRVDVEIEPGVGFKIGQQIAMKGEAKIVTNLKDDGTIDTSVCGMSGSPSK